MTTSKYEIDLRPVLADYEQGNLTIRQFASVVANKLNELSRWAGICGEDYDARAVDSLWQTFDFMSEDVTVTVEELDDALEELYEWADSPGAYDSDGTPVKGAIICRIRNDGQ